MDNTKNNYDEILRKFDNELAKTIQKDVLSACLDTVWDQAYQEGYSKARNEILDEMYGRDTEASDYAALISKFMDAVDDTEHGNRPLADCMGDLFNYFEKHPLEDNQ